MHGTRAPEPRVRFAQAVHGERRYSSFKLTARFPSPPAASVVDTKSNDTLAEAGLRLPHITCEVQRYQPPPPAPPPPARGPKPEAGTKSRPTAKRAPPTPYAPTVLHASCASVTLEWADSRDADVSEYRVFASHGGEQTVHSALRIFTALLPHPPPRTNPQPPAPHHQPPPIRTPPPPCLRSSRVSPLSTPTFTTATSPRPDTQRSFSRHFPPLPHTTHRLLPSILLPVAPYFTPTTHIPHTLLLPDTRPAVQTLHHSSLHYLSTSPRALTPSPHHTHHSPLPTH